MASEGTRKSERTRQPVLKVLETKLWDAETHLTKIIQTPVFDDKDDLDPDLVKEFSKKVETAYQEFESISRDLELKYTGETKREERHAIKRTRLRYLTEVQTILHECRFFLLGFNPEININIPEDRASLASCAPLVGTGKGAMGSQVEVSDIDSDIDSIDHGVINNTDCPGQKDVRVKQPGSGPNSNPTPEVTDSQTTPTEGNVNEPTSGTLTQVQGQNGQKARDVSSSRLTPMSSYKTVDKVECGDSSPKDVPLDPSARTFRPRRHESSHIHTGDTPDDRRVPDRPTPMSLEDIPAVVDPVRPWLDAMPAHPGFNVWASVEVFKKPHDPFGGESHEDFHFWSQRLKYQISMVGGLSGWDKLQILKLHTKGEVLKSVQTFSRLTNPENANDTYERVWKSLKEQYGRVEFISDRMDIEITKLKGLKDPIDIKLLGKLKDYCHSIQNAIKNPDSKDYGLFKYDKRDGLLILAEKLSPRLLEKWKEEINDRMDASPENVPNLSAFTKFLEREFRRETNPFLKKETTSSPTDTLPQGTKIDKGPKGTKKVLRGSAASTTKSSTKPKIELYCPLDDAEGHALFRCYKFRAMEPAKKKEYLESIDRCCICCGEHETSKCDASVYCAVCGKKHHTVLHEVVKLGADAKGKTTKEDMKAKGSSSKSAESDDKKTEKDKTKTLRGSCIGSPTGDEDMAFFSKTQQIKIRFKNDPKTVLSCLALVDDQSRHTFASNKLVHALNLKPPNCVYNLETLAGLKMRVQGHVLSGLQVKGKQRGKWLDLPNAFTGSHIPDTRAERATKQVVDTLPGVSHLNKFFDEEDRTLETLLLIGLDMQELLKIHCVGKFPPYAHRNALGWSIVGYVPKSDLPEGCLAKEASSNAERSFRGGMVESFQYEASPQFLTSQESWNQNADIFETRPDDEENSLSQEDKEFMKILTDGTKVNESGRLEIPLPLKPHEPLPDNEAPVFYRNRTLLEKQKRNPSRLEKAVASMQKDLSLGLKEIVPPEELKPDHEVWYSPIVLVDEPRKDRVRCTFHNGAQFKSSSLNDLLYPGPDMNNSLRGVLLRFRTHTVGFSLDIKHMFHSFEVPKWQRDLLRFHWWKDNCPDEAIVPYRSTVHWFGARSSPGVAVFALKFLAELGLKNGALTEEEAEFIRESFYIDDGLHSLPNEVRVITLIKKIVSFLRTHGVEVHKINSNSSEVKNAFKMQSEEEVVSLDPNTTPGALGVVWDTVSDTFSVKLDIPERPFTRRGILATTNTIFDPLGIASPIVLGARIFQRKILTKKPIQEKGDWDTPLPEEDKREWETWKAGVMSELSLGIPRCLAPIHSNLTKYELHAFSDASQEAVGAVIYLKSIDGDKISVTFVSASSKLVPRAAVTIPRAELCAALLATILLAAVLADIRLPIDQIRVYTDSMVVPGYLRNTTKRFSKYVTRRVEAILTANPLDQWAYVPTDQNPADLTTRPTTALKLKGSHWFSGPEFLKNNTAGFETGEEPDLPETIPSLITCRTSSGEERSIWTKVAERVSRWKTIVGVVKIVTNGSRRWLEKARQTLSGKETTVASECSYPEAEQLLFKESQFQSFPEVFGNENKPDVKYLSNLPSKHPLSGLVPLIADDLIRVGGRLRNQASSFEHKHPVVLSSKSIITKRFIEHLHQISPHQGRLITGNQIRQRGFYVLGGRRLVEDVIKSCVTCQQLRGTEIPQLMSDLPPERVTESAPFDHVGLDVFGPFHVSDGKNTRRTTATKKVFVLLINCLSSRAIHLEPLGGMDTTSVINAIRRFLALRGPCKSMFSDHGSNFMGALGQSDQFSSVKDKIESEGITWKMIPVGASHYGGAYERKIGSVRRVLEASILPHKTHLTRDEFYTLLQEAASVVNSTPLYRSPEGADEPGAISPSMLLTLKSSLPSPPPEALSEADLNAYGKRRWRRVQHLADEFWRRWRDNYIQELTKRRKWSKSRRNLEEDEVVLMKEKNAPRCQWRTAQVKQLIPGKDGLVRRVTVSYLDARGHRQEKERSVVDLIPLFCP